MQCGQHVVMSIVFNIYQCKALECCSVCSYAFWVFVIACG